MANRNQWEKQNEKFAEAMVKAGKYATCEFCSRKDGDYLEPYDGGCHSCQNHGGFQDCFRLDFMKVAAFIISNQKEYPLNIVISDIDDNLNELRDAVVSLKRLLYVRGDD